MAAHTKSDTTRTIRFDAPELEQFFRRFAESPEGDAASESVVVLFVGGSDEQKQQALGTITEAADTNSHQMNLSGLVGDRRIETQGNVREIFDSNQEKFSLLFLEADQFFTDVNRAEYEADEDTLTPIAYLFQRMEHHKGIVILRLTQPDHLAKAREAVHFDMEVEF